MGMTPPMGMSTWNRFGLSIDEKLIMQLADSLVSSGLRDLGYDHLNIDDGYLKPGRDGNGGLIVDTSKFPNGIKYIADYIHSKRLKFGLYTARTLRQCGSKAPGMPGYETQDAKQFAKWEIDYLKVDSCTDPPLPPGSNESEWETLAKIRDALNQTGRPIYLSICPTQNIPPSPTTWYGFQYTVDYGGPGAEVVHLANSWLVEFVNMADCWNCTNGGTGIQGLISQINSQAALTHASYSGPGGWNDMDMLEMCNGGMTVVEYQSHFSLWAILASPLILGNDIRNMPSYCMDLIGNKEVIAVDQDPLGMQGRLVYQAPDNSYQIYVRMLSGQRRCALLFNRMNTPFKISLLWEMLDVGDSTALVVRDLWDHRELGVFQSVFSPLVQPHGVSMIILSLVN